MKDYIVSFYQQFKLTTIIFLIAIINNQIKAQNVGINNPIPAASALLDLTSANKGLLVPRIALTANNVAAPVVAPATSLLVYNIATAGIAPNDVIPGYYYWNGTQWVSLLVSSAGDSKSWLTNGNIGTVDGTHFIGTTDNVPLNFKVNNTEAGKIDHIRRNVFLGKTAGSNNTTGFGTVFIGDSAGTNTTSGYSNVGIGERSLVSNVTGYQNTAIGFWTLRANTVGFGNTAQGYLALNQNISGNYNTANGFSSLRENTAGYNNIAIGARSLYSNTVGYSNVAVGNGSLNSNIGGHRNTAIGDSALSNNTTNENTAIGFKALFENTVGYHSTAIGTNALRANTTGNHNTSMGYNSLMANTVGESNVAIGCHALAGNTTGSDNIAAGHLALNGNSTGSSNIALGNEALGNNSTTSNNIAIGDSSLYSLSTTNSGWNIGIGKGALYGNTTGAIGNVGLGISAGSSITVGSENTFLGSYANASPTVKNSTAIGHRAFVTSDNSIVLGSQVGVNGGNFGVRVGIGVSAPLSTMDVEGSFGNEIRTTTSITSIGGSDHTLLIGSSAPPGLVITLPAATSCDRREYVIVSHSTNLAFTSLSYYNFNGNLTTAIPSNASITIQSNGTNWYRTR